MCDSIEQEGYPTELRCVCVGTAVRSIALEASFSILRFYAIHVCYVNRKSTCILMTSNLLSVKFGIFSKNVHT